ncbi:vitronectin b [Myripristis murdjan]|uniref:vitronectin b n=1 Tax=Myripristis murdjan TaxID=586833 RepID=UPI001175CB73|nr:vitronectin-like [Myripristis murdjan]
MKPTVVLLAFMLVLATTFAAEQSCVGHCGSFNAQRKCQCDSMCVYYGSCCGDYDTVCPKKIARGDTFETPEEMAATNNTPVDAATTLAPTFNTTTVPATTIPPPTTTPGPTLPSDPDAIPCSGRPFDAFLQLKNGSIYAFRGEYFFELDESAVVPGYPKLIKDVWGISGPIDAAFTRINCQGKTYIFKGNKYWRFEDDVLDDDYPRDISVGFDKVPDDVNAAFAIPAPGHHGKEKVYFFKGEQYYQYEFKHQPSHEECIRMTRSSPSVMFTQYTNLFCDQTWEDLFADLFRGIEGHHKGPHFISRDWVGIRAPVDAAMVGRVYLGPKTTPPPRLVAKKRASRKKRPSRRRGQRGRQSRSLFFEDLWSYVDWFADYLDYSDYSDYSEVNTDSTTHEQRSMPVQNVYFFKRDKYYRVDLQTKRVDYARPPYPRSIAKYWLGCKYEETSDVSRAEKR